MQGKREFKALKSCQERAKNKEKKYEYGKERKKERKKKIYVNERKKKKKRKMM
jgi:hypothetical protein